MNSKPHSLRFIIFCVLAITLMFSIVYTVLYFNAKNIIENQLGTVAQSVAVSVSFDIMEDLDDYKTFLETKDVNSDYYKMMQKKFQKIKAESNIKFIFTEKRLDSENIEFILDSEPIGSDEYSPPGSIGPNDWKRETVYSTGVPEKFKVYNHPQWGKIIAAYAPLFDESGELISIIGVNIDVTELIDQLINLFTIMIITYIIIIIIVTAILIKFSNSIIKLTGSLVNSQKATEQSAVSFNVIKTLLDSLDIYLFVTELDTDKIIFVNTKMNGQFHFDGNIIGKVCYEVMNLCMGERCDFCVKRDLLQNPENAESMNVQVEINGIYYKKADRIIEWYDGKKVHLQYFIDISELKQAETKLEAQLAQLQRMFALIDSSPQYISYIDTDGNFEFFNPATIEITGYSYDELMADGINLLYSEDTKQRIKNEVIPAIIAYGKYDFELPLIRKDGEERIMSFSSFSVSSDSKKHGCIAADITEQKRLEKEIIETKEKLECLINTAPIAYGLSIDGVVLECNEYARDYLNMKKGDDTRKFYAQYKEREALLAKTEYNLSANGVIQLYINNGDVHRFFVNYHTLNYDNRKARILWAVDIEESELHNDMLRQMQQSLQTVLDFLPVPITIIDVEEGYVIYANKHAMELFGIESPDQLYEHTVNDFLPLKQPDGTNSFEKTLTLDSDISNSIELVCQKNSGELFEALITACIIDYQGKKASLDIIQDLTKEKEYQKILENTVEKEKEANQAKSRFLSKMSHEIRTPLNAIAGMAGIAKNAAKDNDCDKVIEHIDQITVSSSHLLSVLNDVLDMSKIESGKLELIHEPFSFLQAYKDISNIIIQRCNEKNINFITNINNIKDMTLIGDKLRVNQVLINLMGNAVKFTDYSGEIKFTVDVLEEDDKKVLLGYSVSDNGIGMTKEQTEKLFTPFEQTNSSISVKYGGTGLGLSISQNLINMMGSEIKVESEFGIGSNFNFKIYFEKSNEIYEEKNDMPDSLDLSGKRILLAEDVDINRYILIEILGGTGIEIVEAEDGQQAIEKFNKSSVGYYDLIFMDIQMPVLNGYEATKKIRSLEREDAKSIPIIAMTANVYKEDIDEAFNSGMNGHLSKPIDIKALMETLAKFILNPTGEQNNVIY